MKLNEKIKPTYLDSYGVLKKLFFVVALNSYRKIRIHSDCVDHFSTIYDLIYQQIFPRSLEVDV